MENGVSLAALQSVIKMQSLTGIIAVVMVVGISMLNMAPAVPKTYHWKKSNFKGVLSRYEGCGGADLKQASHVRLISANIQPAGAVQIIWPRLLLVFQNQQ